MNERIINPDNLHQAILQNIVIKKTFEKVFLSLPLDDGKYISISFEEKEGPRDPMYLHSHKVQGWSFSINDDPEFLISDNGETIKALKKRVKDITRYQTVINRICKSYGFNLRSSHIIEKYYIASSSYNHLSQLALIVDIISQVINLDLIWEDYYA